jgi:hypothetical protein
MTDKPYSNREIKLMFDDIKKDVKEIKDVHLKELIAQTTKTNGRVKELEKFRWFLAGGMAIITAIVIPVFIAWLGDKL